MSEPSEKDAIDEDIKLALAEEDQTASAKKVAKIFANHEGHWSGRGQHVEFGRSETIPLNEGRYLGHGSFGDVYEVFCKNLPVARKRVQFKKQVKIADVKKEVEILQKLSHHHIINLFGSYTQNRMLGLLLLPVADCDLGEFLEAIDQTPSDEHSKELCATLGLDASAKHTGQPLDPVLRLRPLMGCIANAIEYLHKNKIRHKDIKPTNILLRKDLVVITDFGLSKDVSEESVTTSSGIEIGAFKYRAPEVALKQPRGRAADIFSLGCVFSQIFAVVKGESLAQFEDILEEDSYGLRSFQKDIDKVWEWQARLRTSISAKTWSGSQIFNLISGMMKRDPSERPNASQVSLTLYSIGSGIDGEASPYHGSCCPPYLDVIDRQRSQIGEYKVKVGEHESRIANYESEIMDYESTLEESKSKFQEIILDYESKLEQSESKLKGSESKLKESESKLRESESKLWESKSNIEELRAKLAAESVRAARNIDELRAKNVEESSAKEAVVAELVNLQADINSMEEMITQMKEDNFTLKAKMNKLERHNNKLTKETFDLRDGMGGMLASRRQLELDLENREREIRLIYVEAKAKDMGYLARVRTVEEAWRETRAKEAAERSEERNAFQRDIDRLLGQKEAAELLVNRLLEENNVLRRETEPRRFSLR